MRQFKYIGELPKGDWRFCLVSMKDAADIILVVDLTGANPPRMIVGDKMVDLLPC